MPRINIEDQLFTDGRFMALVHVCGCQDKALGKFIRATRMAQTYYMKGEKIPSSLFILSGLGELINCGLAENRDDFIYLKGSEDQFKWIEQKRNAGIKSGEKRRKNKEKLNENERTFNNRSILLEQKGNGDEPQSQSQSLNNIYKQTNLSFCLDDVIQLYNDKFCLTHKKKAFGQPNGIDVESFVLTCEFVDSLDKWRNYFTLVENSNFLMGKSGKSKFNLYLGFLLKPLNASDILNGKYDNAEKSEDQEHEEFVKRMKEKMK